MRRNDYAPLLAELGRELTARFPVSAALQHRAELHLVDGGSHNLRQTSPFPPRIAAARGGHLRDEDGHDLLDFWQGHMANLLGHNPEVVTAELSRRFASGSGLQTGMTERLQIEVAEILCRQTGAERVRLTTSGTLAGMYAVLLARAFTGRERVMKVGGGWHGAHPWSLKGCHYDPHDGFAGIDSEGLPAAVSDDVVLTRFNDPQRLEEDFARHGDRLACLLLEPVIGAGGMIPASREYLQLARRLSRHHGALLVLDEVIDGFRFRAGDVASLYGIEADLAVYGKAIGGGMPVAALAGREEILGLAGRAAGERVAASGGTYCDHPASLAAAKVFLEHLVAHEDEIYPRLAELGRGMRDAMVSAFAGEGLAAVCTGDAADLPGGSSLAMVHFPHDPGTAIETPESVFDPAVCDVTLRREVLPVALLLEGVHLVQGHGAAATVHTGADMERLQAACGSVARRVRRFLATGRTAR